MALRVLTLRIWIEYIDRKVRWWAVRWVARLQHLLITLWSGRNGNADKEWGHPAFIAWPIGLYNRQILMRLTYIKFMASFRAVFLVKLARWEWLVYIYGEHLYYKAAYRMKHCSCKTTTICLCIASIIPRSNWNTLLLWKNNSQEYFKGMKYDYILLS